MLGLIKIIGIIAGSLVIFWCIYAFAPRELRVSGMFLLIVLMSGYSSNTFRNWRLRRKLERISRENMKRMRDNYE